MVECPRHPKYVLQDVTLERSFLLEFVQEEERKPSPLRFAERQSYITSMGIWTIPPCSKLVKSVPFLRFEQSVVIDNAIICLAIYIVKLTF